MMRAEVKPEIVRWARERVGHSPASLRKKSPKMNLWERGEAIPTFKQFEAFAKAVFVPMGYPFLADPPGTDPIGGEESFGARGNKVHLALGRKRETSS